MLGLRTQESDKFIQFFKVVQSEAEKQGNIFFLDSEDGHDGVVNNIETCDMFVWLIPKEKASDFEKIWKDGQEDDEWIRFFASVSWKDDNGLKIIFD